MTIVDLEIIGEGELLTNEFQNFPLGIFLEKNIQKKFEQHGDRKWLTDASTGKSMKFSEMLKAMRSVASGLRKRGFQTGDNVLVIGSNSIEFCLMSFGAWRSGGSQVSFYAKYLSVGEMEMRIREIGSKFILTDYNHAGLVLEAIKNLEFVKELFVVGDEKVTGCIPFNVLLEDIGDECPENLADVNMDSMAWLPYSSGTTGLAKGIVASHRSSISTLLPWCYFQYISGFKYLFVNPMCNTAGIWLTMGAALAYMDTYFISELGEINLLSAIDQVKPTEISLFPCHIAWICRYSKLDQYDVSSVKKITAMGSSVNTIYERDIFKKLPNLLFLETPYGMTEVGAVCLQKSAPATEWGALDQIKTVTDRVFGSVGKVRPNCRLKVVDTNSGKKLGPNQVGEICLKSPHMLKEYLNRPEETANFIRDGWAHTGDKGYYDENENIFIVGRYKELIKYRNAHVVPTNIEKHMMTHPAVADVAVVGLPDEVDGEHPLAFVALSPGQNSTVDELINFTNERVADEEKLRGGIRLIDNIPRNGLGKVIRPELMKLFTV